MAAARTPDHRTGVLAKAVRAGAAPVVFGDRRQYLGEMPALAIGLEFLGRDQIAGFVNVMLDVYDSLALSHQGIVRLCAFA